MGREDEKSCYLRPEDAAKVMGCSRTWVFLLIKKGVLRKKKFPNDRKTYVLKKDVELQKGGSTTFKQLSDRVAVLENQLALLQSQLRLRGHTQRACRVLRLNHPDID